MSDRRPESSRRPISDLLNPALEEASVQRVWQGIRKSNVAVKPTSSRRTLALGATTTLAIAAACLLAWRFTTLSASTGIASRNAGVSVAPGSELVASNEGAPREVALDDGSRLELARGAELDVMTNDGERFVTALRRGACHFRVQPGGPRRWEIETDLATVEVVGTEFTVERIEGHVFVTVDHGVVLVHGERVPGRVQRLTAGARLDVPEAVAAETTAPERPGTDALDEARPIEEAALIEVPPGVDVPDEPQTSRENVREARETPHALSLEQALDTADLAIEARRFSEAADTLEAAIAARPRDPRAAVAYYQLGRIALDELHQPARAARAFQTVIRLRRPRALLDDAHIRRIEALAANGERTLAAQELAAWEQAGADPRHVEEARRFLN